MRNAAVILFVTVLLAGWSTGAGADTAWQRVDAPAQFIDSQGVERRPSCSGGPVPDPTFGFVPASTDYAFFIRHGNPNKLAVVFDGGGTCFNAATCVGTAFVNAPIYAQVVDETALALEAAGGLGRLGHPDNPIADYTQVFIPYCTGDLHTGANSQVYFFPLGGNVVPWTIHHRGADNVTFVLEWLDRYYATEVGAAPRDVFLTGLSAGGYGVTYHTPAIADRLPWNTSLRVLADAASGVITDNFYNLALVPGGNWAAWDNLSPVLADAFSAGPDRIVVEVFKALGRNYPRARFGQYTTAFDETQIFFYNVDRNINDPAAWFDPGELLAAGIEWTLQARSHQLLTALQVWNYRFYLAAGTDHTVLASDKFYTEDSGSGVALVDWLDDMLNRRWPWGSDWRNVTCAPNCLP